MHRRQMLSIMGVEDVGVLAYNNRTSLETDPASGTGQYCYPEVGGGGGRLRVANTIPVYQLLYFITIAFMLVPANMIFAMASL